MRALNRLYNLKYDVSHHSDPAGGGLPGNHSGRVCGRHPLELGERSTGTIVCQGGGGCPGEVQSFYLASHDVRLGFRYILPTLTPPPPPPLIRKY